MKTRRRVKEKNNIIMFYEPHVHAALTTRNAVNGRDVQRYAILAVQSSEIDFADTRQFIYESK